MSELAADLDWLIEDYEGLSCTVENDRAVGAGEHIECEAERVRARAIVDRVRTELGIAT